MMLYEMLSVVIVWNNFNLQENLIEFVLMLLTLSSFDLYELLYSS